MSAEQLQVQTTSENKSRFESAYAEFNKSRMEARRLQSEMDIRAGKIAELQIELGELKRDHDRVRKNAEIQGERLKGLLENEIKNW